MYTFPIFEFNVVVPASFARITSHKYCYGNARPKSTVDSVTHTLSAVPIVAVGELLKTTKRHKY